ncbi:MAG: hypothetical protein WBG38_01945 [Nodosilinea sp.]
MLFFDDVQAIGIDAVITSSQGAIAKNRPRKADAGQMPAVSHILEHNTILKGTRILTMDGRNLGVIIDCVTAIATPLRT